MKRTLSLTALLPLFLAAAAPSNNPVDLYRQALGKLDWDVEGKTNLLDNVDQTAVDAATEKYLSDRRPIIDLLRQAATQPSADWGPVAVDALRERGLSLNGYRHAALLLVLQSRFDMAKGRPAEAVDDLLTMIAMGRHVGQQEILIGRLLEVGIEVKGINELARILPALPHDLVASLPARLDALPHSTTLARTLAAEQHFGEQDAKGKPQFQQVEALQQQLATFYESLIAVSDKSIEDFDRAISAGKEKFKDNPFVATLAPSLSKVRPTLAVEDAKRAMLATAIDVVLHGPAAAARSKDPFGDGAFKYRALEQGFELTSALKERGDSVNLTVGQPKAP